MGNTNRIRRTTRRRHRKATTTRVGRRGPPRPPFPGDRRRDGRRGYGTWRGDAGATPGRRRRRPVGSPAVPKRGKFWSKRERDDRPCGARSFEPRSGSAVRVPRATGGVGARVFRATPRNGCKTCAPPWRRVPCCSFRVKTKRNVFGWTYGTFGSTLDKCVRRVQPVCSGARTNRREGLLPLGVPGTSDPVGAEISRKGSNGSRSPCSNTETKRRTERSYDETRRSADDAEALVGSCAPLCGKFGRSEGSGTGPNASRCCPSCGKNVAWECTSDRCAV